MNPILIIGAFIAIALIWLLCAFSFKYIGRFFSRLFSDAKNAILEEDINNKNKEDLGED